VRYYLWSMRDLLENFSLYTENDAYPQEMVFLKNILKLFISPEKCIFIPRYAKCQFRAPPSLEIA